MNRSQSVALLSLSTLIAGCNPSTTPTAGGATSNNPLRIFVTQNSYTGALGGIASAHDKCNTDPGRPASGFFKALMVDGTHRLCASANCLGAGTQNTTHVFAANREYRRLDDSTIGITNSNAIFDFPLSEAFGGSSFAWTGLNADWTTSPDLCGNWSTTTGSGQVGFSAASSAQAISYTAITCSTPAILICVEQAI